MSEPPPTPVNPTRRPTANPEIANTGSMPCNIVEACWVAQNLMSIELLDFPTSVNRHTCGDMASSAFFEGEIGPARDNYRRPNQRGGGRPLAKHHDAGNDHPDELSVGEWRQRWRRRVSMGDDQHSVAGGAENTHHGRDRPNSHRSRLLPNPGQYRSEKHEAGDLRPRERRLGGVRASELAGGQYVERIADNARDSEQNDRLKRSRSRARRDHHAEKSERDCDHPLRAHPFAEHRSG